MTSFHMIMPIGSDNLSQEKIQIIKQTSEIYGFNAILPKYSFSEESFIEEIFNEISDSLFGIADLSFERPSCYYELGISEALNKKMYLIARKDTVIHQASNRNSIQFYTDLDCYKETIIKIISDVTTKN